MAAMRPLLGSALATVLLLASAGCLRPASRTSATMCPAEASATNDTQQSAKDLGELQDDPDSHKGIASSIHASKDDWYRVHIKDTGIGGDPVVKVSVPSGFTVTTWFDCDHGTPLTSECQYGSSDPLRIDEAEGCRSRDVEPVTDSNGATTLGTGSLATSTTDCSGTSSDNGTLYIRVERNDTFAACSYDLAIDVE